LRALAPVGYTSCQRRNPPIALVPQRCSELVACALRGPGSEYAVPWGQGGSARVRSAILALTAAVVIPSVAAAEGADYASESLFFEDIPTVITVSRAEERITDAPAAVSVITADDLRQFGVTRLADAFRLVPGVDVFWQDAHASAVSARGYNSSLARTMQVLLDGRSVYDPLWGSVIWDSILVDMEDIDRIEVIRGPNAALYGANSFAGVINIITKRPDTVEGVTLSYRGGNDDYARGFGRYAGSVGNLSYRISGSYHDDDGHGGSDGDAYRDSSRNRHTETARLSYAIPNGDVLDVWGGEGAVLQDVQYQADALEDEERRRGAFGQIRYTGHTDMDGEYRIQYGNRRWWTRAVWMYERPDVLTWNDVEFQHAFHPSDRHRLVWGLNYRSTECDSVNMGSWATGVADHEVNDETRRVFVNETFYATDRWTLVGGAMYEDNTITGDDVSPRASVLYSPVVGHTLRATWSRAFRTPAAVEYAANSGIPGLVWFEGNGNLDPERVDSYELGAKGFLPGNLDYALDFYYQRIYDRITKRWGSLWPTFPIVFYGENVEGVDIGRGVEAEVGYSPMRGLRAFAHYTYQYITSHDTLDLYAIPQSKAGAGCRWRSAGGLSAGVSANYVKSHDEYNMDDFFLERVLKVDSYVRLDARVAQSFWDDRAELALIGHNLLEPTHVEYPLTRVARQVYAELSLSF